MATGADVLQMLCPEAKWCVYGDDFDSINWFDENPPITKKQFLDGFAEFDAWVISEQNKTQQAKQLLLEKLGITEEEARLLLA